MARVKHNGKWGFVNLEGKSIIPAIYDDAKDFSDGFAAVCLNKKWGFINKQGKTEIAFKYDGVKRGFSEGLAPVSLLNKWGFINPEGKVIIPTKFDSVRSFQDGIAMFKIDQVMGSINAKGDILASYEVSKMSLMSGFKPNGLRMVNTAEGTGFMNREGKIVIPTRFAHQPRILDNGLVQVWKEGDSWIFNAEGRVVVSKEYVSPHIWEFKNIDNQVVVRKKSMRDGTYQLIQ